MSRDRLIIAFPLRLLHIYLYLLDSSRLLKVVSSLDSWEFLLAGEANSMLIYYLKVLEAVSLDSFLINCDWFNNSKENEVLHHFAKC